MAQGQGPDPDGLKSMLSIGLESNYKLKIIRAEQQQYENEASIAYAGYLPDLALDNDNDFTNDVTNTKVRADGSNYTTRANNFSSALGLDLGWTIFDGFLIRTNHERYKELASRSRVETRLAIEDFIASLASEYFNNVQQKQKLENLRSAAALSRERLRIVRARYMVGDYSRLDLQQARVDFNVDSANYIKQLEMVYTSSVELAKLMVLDDVTEPVEVQDTVITINIDLNYDDILHKMMANNSELISAEHDVNIAKLDMKRVLARNYPSIGFSSGYDYNYDSYSRTTTRRTHIHGFAASVDVDISLFDPKRRTDRRNAQIDIDNANLSFADVELELRAKLATVWQAYTNNLKLLRLEQSSIVAASDNYTIAMERYMLGNLSGIEMREAQISLLDAEERIVTATYNTKLCEISLLLLSGEITRYL